jgi:hypothetical protein
MNLDKLFGSQTKVDIFKYLIFKRQGISMRALESELTWTFPAIKKQVDSLNEAKIVDIDKSGQSRSIVIKPELKPLLKNFLLYALQKDLDELLTSYDFMIDTYYRGKLFGNDIEPDLVVIYKQGDVDQIDKIKQDVSQTCRGYFIDMVSMTFMSAGEREKRYRLADRFVLSIMRAVRQ